MRFKKTLFLFAVTLAFATVATGQDKSLGAIKGKVRVETGTPAGVTVVVRRGDTEVTRSTTDKNGDFVVSKLTPGKYGVTFRKPGLSIGSSSMLRAEAWRIRKLSCHEFLKMDPRKRSTAASRQKPGRSSFDYLRMRASIV
jgi:hypothetical protein